MRSRLRRLVALIGHARARHLLVVCGLLMGAMLAAATVLVLLDLRPPRHRGFRTRTAEPGAHPGRGNRPEMQAIELVQRGLIAHLAAQGVDSVEELRQVGGSAEQFHDLQKRISGLAQIAALAISDPDGRLINFSRSWPPPPNDDSDRDFIRAMQGPDAPSLFISTPLRSKSGNRWTIYLTSRLTTRRAN